MDLFDAYVRHEYAFAATQLVLAMLGMGATLTVGDFREVARAPRSVSIGLVLQLIGVPLVAAAFVAWGGLGVGVAIGLALCAAIPGGTVSNIFTYFARGHIALSISLTAVATLACLVTTPIVLGLLIAHHMPEDFSMPAGRIAIEIGLCLLLPLVLGMLVLRAFPAQAGRFSKLCIRGSLLTIGLIVVGAAGAGRLDIEAFGLSNLGITVGFIAVVTLLGWLVPRMLAVPTADRAAIGIELTVRNTNLGLLIKASLFPAVVGVSDPVGDQVLFTVLLYGALMLLIGGVQIGGFRRRVRAEHNPTHAPRQSG